MAAETSLMALMKGIELHNTKPGLKMSSRVSRLLPWISQFCGENANSALVLVTYMDGGSKQSSIFASLRSREIKVDLSVRFATLRMRSRGVR